MSNVLADGLLLLLTIIRLLQRLFLWQATFLITSFNSGLFHWTEWARESCKIHFPEELISKTLFVVTYSHNIAKWRFRILLLFLNEYQLRHVLVFSWASSFVCTDDDVFMFQSFACLNDRVGVILINYERLKKRDISMRKVSVERWNFSQGIDWWGHSGCWRPLATVNALSLFPARTCLRSNIEPCSVRWSPRHRFRIVAYSGAP